MALVTHITKRVEIPHEAGEWLELRKLSWVQLERAKDEATSEQMRVLREMGGDLVASLQAARGAETPAAGGTSYSKAALLGMGIGAWSYDAPVTPENIGLLDEPTAAFAFAELVALNTAVLVPLAS